MGKYDALRDYLRAQEFAEFSLTFGKIEEIVGCTLPKSAARPQWWENEQDPTTGRPQRIAWRDAGFDAFLIKDAKRVTFRRTK